MSIEATETGILIVVLVMAIVTLATRWGGVYVMSFVPINYRVKRFIQAMSGSVLVAVLTPIAVTGDGAERVALMTTAAIMLILKKPLPAIAAGVMAAAMVRHF
ncbi:AzlD family protein [Achromobacter spanius]|uniref:AzlD family protein n=1 Tax=Achromobacter spanius TaxID=217203 RepID=UPI0037F9955C